MNKRELKKHFFTELDRSLPEISGMPSEANRKPKGRRIVLITTLLGAFAIAGGIAGGFVAINNLGKSPYYNAIVAKLTAESHCERAMPDFKEGLVNPNNKFYCVKRSLELSSSESKIALYLPSDKARAAEIDCEVPNLLEWSVFGGGAFYYGACKYLPNLQAIAYSKTEELPFKKGNLELVSVYYQANYEVLEEIISDTVFKSKGIFYQPVGAKVVGSHVSEEVNPYQSLEVYESKIDLEKLTPEYEFNPFFASPYFEKIGYIRNQNEFVYHKSYYSGDKYYEVPELAAASKPLFDSSDECYCIDYLTYKDIMRNRANYYRNPVEIEAKARYVELNDNVISEESNASLINSENQLNLIGIKIGLLDKYDKSYFESCSIIFVSQCGPKLSAGETRFDRVDRRGDKLEVHFVQTKSYETKGREIFWAIEIAKIEQEPRNPVAITIETTIENPANLELLNVFSQPSIGYSYRKAEGAVSEWELLSFSVLQRGFRAPYDAGIKFTLKTPWVPKDTEHDGDPNRFWSISKLVRDGKTITAYLQKPPKWSRSATEQSLCSFAVDVYSDFIGQATNINISLEGGTL